MKRKKLFYILVQNYVSDKKKSKARGRANSTSYIHSIHSIGMLQGACMAYELDIEENEDVIKIVTRKRKKIVVEMSKN